MSHLGGHFQKTHVDYGAIEWAKRIIPITSMLDVGCGPGGMASVADHYQIEWSGVDGDPSVEADRIQIHDFTTGPLFVEECDLVWCVEFAEHVEEKFVDNFLPCLQSGRLLIFSAAPPGKKGYHHVNCRPCKYWIRLLAGYGMNYSSDLTIQLRKATTMKREFIRTKGMVFVNESRESLGSDTVS